MSRHAAPVVCASVSSCVARFEFCGVAILFAACRLRGLVGCSQVLRAHVCLMRECQAAFRCCQAFAHASL